MTEPIISHRNAAVPYSALTFGVSGDTAVPVSRAMPLPCIDSAYRNARALGSVSLIEPGSAVLVDCAGQGTVVFEFAEGATISLTVPAGLMILPFAVRRFVAAGTTATFAAWVLD